MKNNFTHSVDYARRSMTTTTSEMINIVTFSAITIVNALPCGRGSALAIDIPTHIVIKTSDRDYIDSADSDTLQKFVNMYRRELGIEDRFTISVRSCIPSGSGLKSSSSVTSGIAIGIAALSKPEMKIEDCIKISCKICKKLGISYTGALDDATASVIGGLVYTINDEYRIDSIVDVDDDLKVLIMIFNNWQRPRDLVERFRNMRNDPKIRNIFEKIYNLAFKNPLEAASLNTIYMSILLGYDLNLIYRIQREFKPTATLLSGNGPAIAVLDSDVEKLYNVLKSFRDKLSFFRICRTLPQLRMPNEEVSKYFKSTSRLMLHLKAELR